MSEAVMRASGVFSLSKASTAGPLDLEKTIEEPAEVNSTCPVVALIVAVELVGETTVSAVADTFAAVVVNPPLNVSNVDDRDKLPPAVTKPLREIALAVIVASPSAVMALAVSVAEGAVAVTVRLFVSLDSVTVFADRLNVALSPVVTLTDEAELDRLTRPDMEVTDSDVLSTDPVISAEKLLRSAALPAVALKASEADAENPVAVTLRLLLSLVRLAFSAERKSDTSPVVVALT
jgi:hypothetical protein